MESIVVEVSNEYNQASIWENGMESCNVIFLSGPTDEMGNFAEFRLRQCSGSPIFTILSRPFLFQLTTVQ